jgi:hypothetical protein
VKPPKLILNIADKMGFDVKLDEQPPKPAKSAPPVNPPPVTKPSPSVKPPKPSNNVISKPETNKIKKTDEKKASEPVNDVLKKAINQAKHIKDSEAVTTAVTATVKVKDYISENLTFLIGGVVCILIVMVIAVFAAINWGDMKTRVVKITEISGEVTVESDARIRPASKNTKLAPGDIITLSDDARVRLKIDPDKYLTIEPDSSLYIDYTNIEGMGDVTVNLLFGSVITEMSEEIKTKDSFLVVTPNTMIDVRKSVFRTEFEYFSDYGGTPAKITTVENFSGNINLQLFDDLGAKADNLMILKARNSAKLVTTPSTAVYNGLNYTLALENLPQLTLTEILRISNNFTPLAYSTIELNDALKIVAERNYQTASSATIPETVSVTPFEPIPVPSETESLPREEEIIIITTTAPPQTVPTTQTLGEMTTYTGEKWWEITNTAKDSEEDTKNTDVSTD